MPHFEVGLGTNSRHVCLADLMPVVAALDVQAREHVGPIWNLTARVSLLEDPGNVPVGMSPILVTDEMPGQIHGVHVMDQDVAFAMVLAAEGWELAASHECIEMLIDPSGGTKKPGRRLAITDGILGDADGLVEYIVEACDPVEDASYAYQIGGGLGFGLLHAAIFRRCEDGRRALHVSGPVGRAAHRRPQRLSQLARPRCQRIAAAPQFRPVGDHPARPACPRDDG